jgi:hypothetical protein
LGGSGIATLPYETRVDQWGGEPEYAGSITGIFSGWDLSFYVARIYQNRTTPVINLPTFDTTPVLSRDDRVTMFGFGGNYTSGSWLFKAEIAYFDELDYYFLAPNPNLTDPFDVYNYWVPAQTRVSRLDSLLGVEYYGFTDLTIAFEAAYRHLFDYDPLLQYLPNYLYEDNVEIALRLRYELMNTRLKLNALGLVLVNSGGYLGSTLRADAEYELMEGLALSGGLLYFIGGDQVPFDSWNRNARLFAKIKYSF